MAAAIALAPPLGSHRRLPSPLPLIVAAGYPHPFIRKLSLFAPDPSLGSRRRLPSTFP